MRSGSEFQTEGPNLRLSRRSSALFYCAARSVQGSAPRITGLIKSDFPYSVLSFHYDLNPQDLVHLLRQNRTAAFRPTLPPREAAEEGGVIMTRACE